MWQSLVSSMAWMLQTLYQYTGNLGVAIIILTVIIRIFLLPLTLPSQKQQVVNRDKLKQLKPQLEALKKKHQNDRNALAQAQMQLYRQHNIKFFSWSFLLSFGQLFVFVALYRVFINYLSNGSLQTDPTFIGFHLVQKDNTYIMPILAAGTQLLLSLMIAPGVEKHDLVAEKPASHRKKQKQASAQSKAAQTGVDRNAQELDQQEMAETVSQQMLFMLPIMTGLFAINFPSGLVLYWITNTLFSMFQQYLVSGWGGLAKVKEWQFSQIFKLSSGGKSDGKK